MVRQVTLKEAKKEIYIFALKIWVGVAVSLLLLAYALTQITGKFLSYYAAQDLQGTAVPPLVFGIIFFIPFAITTAHKRWIWSDASTIWKYPAAAIANIRENSLTEKKAQSEYRPPRYGYRDADKSVRILPDYIQARTIALEQMMETDALIDNGPSSSVENSFVERPLRWYEMFIIPAIVILVPAAIFGFCYFSSMLGWKVCWS